MRFFSSVLSIAIFGTFLCGCGGGDKVKITDTLIGKGPTVVTGSHVSVVYTGKLKNGIEFDTNVSGKPFEFTVGSGRVIKGWDLGVMGMRVGGERDLEVPASLAYGSNSPGVLVPANSDLLFHVKLLEIK